MNRLRQQVKTALDAAITAGAQPSAPKSGLGLVVKTPVGRFRTLVDKKGITPAGEYYYQKNGLPPPKSFEFQKDTTRKGRTQYIKLLDGTQKAVSRWDNVNREWKLTKLGNQFYSKAVDKYTVLWPVKVHLTRINGSIFEREDWMPAQPYPLWASSKCPGRCRRRTSYNACRQLNDNGGNNIPPSKEEKCFCQAMKRMYLIAPERFNTTNSRYLSKVMWRRSCTGHCGRANHGDSPS